MRARHLLFITTDPQRWDRLLATLQGASSALLADSSSALLADSSSALLADSSSALLADSSSALLADSSSALRQAVFSEIAGRAMVCDGRWKQVHYDTGEAVLYDLEDRLQEVDDLADRAALAGQAARLRGLLLAHWLGSQRQQQIPNRRSQHPFCVVLEAAWRAAGA